MKLLPGIRSRMYGLLISECTIKSGTGCTVSVVAR